jgi:branched-chain amino acid transport system ATP-binding protein
MDDILTVKSVRAGFGPTAVLNDVSLTVRDDLTVALLGRNGVGKSTLLATIMGMTTLYEGKILLKGQDITSAAIQRRNELGIGYVPQEREIFPSLTVNENVGVAIRPGNWTRDRVYDLFPRLYERRRNYGNQLSGGEQQMLAIARALVGNPTVLLLDEPFEGLAPVIMDLLVDAIKRIRTESRIPSIIVEHHVDLALEMADQAIVLDRGKIVWSGTSAELQSQPDLVATLIGIGVAPMSAS